MMGNSHGTELRPSDTGPGTSQGQANAIAVANSVGPGPPGLKPGPAGPRTRLSSRRDHLMDQLRLKLKLFHRRRHIDVARLQVTLRTVNESESAQLNRYQRTLLIDAWRQANPKGSNAAGLWIFKQIFSLQPQIKRIFRLDKIPAKHLDTSIRFQKHAQVFTNLLEIIVSSLDKAEENIGPLLLYYGSKHVRLESTRSVAFHHEYWNVFGRAMCDYSTTWQLSRRRGDTERAWCVLVNYVVKKMWEGFELEKERCIISEHEHTRTARTLR